MAPASAPSPSAGGNVAESGPGAAEKKPEKSYFASAVESINPWSSSRSTSPNPRGKGEELDKDKGKQKRMPHLPLAPSQAPSKNDHSTKKLYGPSPKFYPADCPPLNVQWFHAVDVPKRKPQYLKSEKEKENERGLKSPSPKKFVAFSATDSQSLEQAYQKLLEQAENDGGRGAAYGQVGLGSRRALGGSDDEAAPNTSIDEVAEASRKSVRVPVNEDFLFDVEILERELAPTYWLGPVYQVVRGSWFYQEGSTLRACEENLAAQLEEGYLKVKPWTYPGARSGGNSRKATPKSSAENLKVAAASQEEHQPQTYRLFGTYMNSVATYQDAHTAWLSSDGVLSWVSSTVYQRFGGGGYMSGVKLVRGYSESPRAKEEKRAATPTTIVPADRVEDADMKAAKQGSLANSAQSDQASDQKRVADDEVEDTGTSEAERMGNQLKKQLSNYIDSSEDAAKRQEVIRKREEQEIQDDYNARVGETQNREIEHLVLVVHGVGQMLGLRRLEAINFVHDVNVLRKTLKEVYSNSADLRVLNSDCGDPKGPGNSRVQVLPVCWRHLLDFPKRADKSGEGDLGTTPDDEDEYPSLADITVEGAAFARSIISDLALDVLLYQSAYRELIADIVSKEANRIYKLFLERNPNFRGKVHVMGHSLGSAILFDIVCKQQEAPAQSKRHPLRFWPSANRPGTASPKDGKLALDFPVEDLYCLGSPIGLFQMLKGRTIAARPSSRPDRSKGPIASEYTGDPFLQDTASHKVSPVTGLSQSVSSPKVSQIFNIFHPSDPIGYRLEPLVSTAMSSLKPQPLPYTKKGLFDSVAPQGLSGIGARVGQSVSGIWSSISGGIASSLLNRSLGVTSEDVANYTAKSAVSPNQNTVQPAVLSPDFGPDSNGSSVTSDTTLHFQRTAERRRALARQNTAAKSSSSSSLDSQAAEKDATLIDDELETLFAKFQKKRIQEYKEAASRADEGQQLGDAWAAEEARAHKLRREERKIRALNRNGRIDYSIQESFADYNPINAITSHMSYWQDEDVSHFVLGQLLSNRRAPSRR